MPVLSKIKADRIKNWAKIQEIYEDDGVIKGKIIRRVKGGLKVDIGIDAFMPASQLTIRLPKLCSHLLKGEKWGMLAGSRSPITRSARPSRMGCTSRTMSPP